MIGLFVDVDVEFCFRALQSTEQNMEKEKDRDREGNLLGKEMIQTFIAKPEITKKLINLTSSSLAVYKTPRNLFENLANILTVAMDLRWGSDGVYQKYRDWTRDDYPLQEIAEYLDRATGKIIIRQGKIIFRPPGKQTLITEYFENGSYSGNVSGNINTVAVDLENNQKE